MPPRGTSSGNPDMTGQPVPRGAERRLLEAVDRLRRGSPTNPELKARAAAGRLRVNPSTATMEAGCARRLAYVYPRVRSALGMEDETAVPGSEEAAPGRGRSLQETVVQLRAEKAALKRERDLALSQSAALVVRLRQMEEEIAAEVRKAKRANPPAHPNRVTGNIHRLFPDPED